MSSHVAILSLGVHLQPLEELLKIYSPADDLPPAGGAEVRIQLEPAVATHEVALGTLEHSELTGVLHVTDLRVDNHGGEINK